MRSAARKNIKKRGTEKGRGHAPENGCSACGAYDEGVSVPAFRRPETEGHDCHALVCKPEILIADEPTTALDVTIQAQILDLMNQLKKETGTSILFITHDLGVVAEVCDDVAVMYCGRVVERGDVKTIFANPSHPYTKGLLGSIPRLGDAGKELKSIPGNVPNPKYMPKGCKFEPRCPYASEKCREEEPGFFQIEEGHISRCWLCESGQLKTDHVEKAGD